MKRLRVRNLIQICWVASVVSHLSCKSMVFDQVGAGLLPSVDQLKSEPDWDHFKEVTPSMLFIVETLLAQAPDQADMLSLLTQGWGAYSYGVLDTNVLESHLQGKSVEIERFRLYHGLIRAQEFGSRLVHQLEGKSTSKSGEGVPPLAPASLEVAKKDPLAMFYYGFTGLLLANAFKENIALAARLPGSYDWVKLACTVKPDLENGLCLGVDAIYDFALPPSIGGKPDSARKKLAAAIKTFPDNHLLKVLGIEWEAIPLADEAAFKKWELGLPKMRSFEKNKFSLINAIALKRYDVIARVKKDLF